MLNVRPVNSIDVDCLFHWANEPVVRKNAFNTSQIKYEDHIVWFKNKLDSIDSYIFILEENAIPIGQIRFDLHHDPDCFRIDYSIAAGSQKKGYGTGIIAFGLLELVKKKVSCRIVQALVKPDNKISIRCFLKNKFKIMIENKELVTLEVSLDEFKNE